MAVKRPSFLKKLKEQQRRARAEEKRVARRARKLARNTNLDENSGDADLSPIESEGEDSAEAEAEPLERATDES